VANRALGLIEVKGKVGSIAAADAAVKAANVELLGTHRVSGGLLTVHLIGDVGAIYAAVEAGVAVVKDTNNFIASHVIPRLDEQVENMLLEKFNKTKKDKEAKKEQTQSKEPSETVENNNSLKVKPETLEALKEETVSPVQETIRDIAENSSEDSTESTGKLKFEKEDLEKLKVGELRSIAYKQNVEGMTKKEIKFANKETLIQILLEKGVKGE